MNHRLVAGCILVMALACNKDSSKIQNSSTLPLSSTRYSSLNQRSIRQNFNYDGNQNITGLTFSIADTSGSEVATNNGDYSFTYTAGSNLPSAYIYHYHNILLARGYDGGAQSESHLLYYNSDNRLIKDSGLFNMPTTYFSYSGNTITWSIWIHDGDSVVSYYRDSVVLDNQGMLAFNYQFNKNGASWNINTISYMNNENLKNPFYQKNRSESLGILFLAQNLGDFISADLMTEFGSSGWITDSWSRVVSNVPENGEIIQFTYP